MMYPDRPKRVTKSVSFGDVETQDDDEQSSRVSGNEVDNTTKSQEEDDNTHQDSSKNTDNKEGGEAKTNDSTLEVPHLSKRKPRRRSLLMRMVDEESDLLPPRESMLKSQRIELGEDYTLSSDDEDDEEQTRKESSGHFTTPHDMEQASKPKGSNEFSFKKFKHLPDIVVTPTKEPMEGHRRYLTQDEIRKLHMSEDDLIKKSLVMSNCMKTIGVILLMLLFGFTAVGIGYTIGQNE